MITTNKLLYALKQIEQLFPEAKAELDYQNPYQLLIAVMLSAQSTDKQVNKITPRLFARYPNPESIAESTPKEIEPFIQTLGLYHNKAKYMYRTGVKLVNEFTSNIPKTREALMSLPGIGRKSANVVLSVAFGKPAIPVDTHVERVSKRLGVVSDDATPLEVEQKLMQLLPEEEWSLGGQLLLLFGRYYCTARSVVTDWLPYLNLEEYEVE